MNPARRNSILPGLILIGLGVLFLVGRSVYLGGWIWLVGLGAVFIIAYLSSRSYGLLIPGCILVGLGLGDALGQSSLGLGLGFVAIFVVDTLVKGRASHWWPLIPGVIIAGDALANTRIGALGTLRSITTDWWPLLLIGLGLLILFQRSNRR
jgi:hypothetical protein